VGSENSRCLSTCAWTHASTPHGPPCKWGKRLCRICKYATRPTLRVGENTVQNMQVCHTAHPVSRGEDSEYASMPHSPPCEWGRRLCRMCKYATRPTLQVGENIVQNMQVCHTAHPASGGEDSEYASMPHGPPCEWRRRFSICKYATRPTLRVGKIQNMQVCHTAHPVNGGEDCAEYASMPHGPPCEWGRRFRICHMAHPVSGGEDSEYASMPHGPPCEWGRRLCRICKYATQPTLQVGENIAPGL